MYVCFLTIGSVSNRVIEVAAPPRSSPGRWECEFADAVIDRTERLLNSDTCRCTSDGPTVGNGSY